MSYFNPSSSESLSYETLSSSLQNHCNDFLTLVVAEVIFRTAPRVTIRFPLWMITPQPSGPEGLPMHIPFTVLENNTVQENGR